jgi:hypothetical protein
MRRAARRSEGKNEVMTDKGKKDQKPGTVPLNWNEAWYANCPTEPLAASRRVG